MAVDEEKLLAAIRMMRAEGKEPDCILVPRDCFVPDTELEIIRLEHLPPGVIRIGIKGDYILPEGEGEWRGD